MPDLSYGGFCPVALISGQGFAVPGKPDLGVLCHKVMNDTIKILFDCIILYPFFLIVSFYRIWIFWRLLNPLMEPL